MELVTRGVLLELFADTVLNHINIQCSMYQAYVQQVSSAFFGFHGVEEQKTHQEPFLTTHHATG